VAERSKREEIQRRLDAAGLKPSARYADRSGAHLAAFVGEGSADPSITTPISGHFFRLGAAGDLAAAGSAPWPARYHRVGEPLPLYMSSTDQAALAEMTNVFAPIDEARATWVRLHKTLLTVDVARLDVLDLRDPRTLAKLGISIADLTAPTWQAAQMAAARARALGAEGIVAPSRVAADAGTLVVFARDTVRLSVVDRRVVTLDVPLPLDQAMVDDFRHKLAGPAFDQWRAAIEAARKRAPVDVGYG
jgi:RES domain-containing protein